MADPPKNPRPAADQANPRAPHFLKVVEPARERSERLSRNHPAAEKPTRPQAPENTRLGFRLELLQLSRLDSLCFGNSTGSRCCLDPASSGPGETPGRHAVPHDPLLPRHPGDSDVSSSVSPGRGLSRGTPRKPDQVPDGFAEFDRIHLGTFTEDLDLQQTYRIGGWAAPRGPEGSADL